MPGADYCTHPYTVMHTSNHVLILITSLLVELLHQRELDVVCAHVVCFDPNELFRIENRRSAAAELGVWVRIARRTWKNPGSFSRMLTHHSLTSKLDRIDPERVMIPH